MRTRVVDNITYVEREIDIPCPLRRSGKRNEQVVQAEDDARLRKYSQPDAATATIRSEKSEVIAPEPEPELVKQGIRISDARWDLIMKRSRSPRYQNLRHPGI
jgi:hypothetical protein